jgi:hypothetical protein
MTTSYRLPASTGGTPAAAKTAQQRTESETILPDRKHTVTTVDGVLQSELLLVDGMIYARGPAAPGLSPTRPNPDEWTTIDPATIDASSLAGQALSFFSKPLTPPYGELSKNERERAAVPGEPVTVNGQTCDTYTIADTTQTGDRIEITLAIGANDLPCSIQSRLGESTSLTTYEYNIPLSIDAPAATPAAGA